MKWCVWSDWPARSSNSDSDAVNPPGPQTQAQHMQGHNDICICPRFALKTNYRACWRPTVLYCILTGLCVFPSTDTDYISEEEKQKVELMLAFLTEESKQAAASTAVSTISTASCCCCQSIRDVQCPSCVLWLSLSSDLFLFLVSWNVFWRFVVVLWQ